MAFGKCLNDDQRALIRLDVSIAKDNKLQFYLEEIYDSNHFDKQEILMWEQEPSATKTVFTLAKAHFEASSKPPTPTSRTQAAEQQDATGTTPPIEWQTMATKSVSTSNNSPAQVQPKQQSQQPTSKLRKN